MLRLALISFVFLLVLGLACDSGTPGPAAIRIAHLVPDAPAVDVCLKPDGVAAFGSPFVGGTGLAYPSLSGRAAVDAGTYSVRIIGGGSSCASSLNSLGDKTGVVIGADATQTLALTGRLSGTGTPAVDVRKYDDRTTASPSGSVSLRAVNAAPGSTPQDVGVVSGGSLFQAFATGVAFGSASGYQPINITPGATNVTAALAAQDSSSQALWALGTFGNVSDTGVYTLYVIGVPGQTATLRPSLLLCSDSSVNCAQSP